MATYSSVHHGRGRSQRRGESRRPGQWKLAYADFLTALTAFFLLMWLSTNSSEAERSAIAAYFSGEDTPGYELVKAPISNDLELMLAARLQSTPALDAFSDHISLTTTPTGLRIDLTDADQGFLFSTSESQFSPSGYELIMSLGHVLSIMPFDLRIEGHTDAFKPGSWEPSNWDLSSARANEALRLLTEAGIAPDRFKAVTGLAATQPLLPTQPHAAMNRRISILLEISS